MPEGRDVLEQLCRELDCDYLSDLRMPQYRGLAVRRATGLEEDLTVPEWREIIYYLTGERAAVSSPEEARAFLRAWSSPKEE